MGMEGFACLGAFILIATGLLAGTGLVTWLTDDYDFSMAWFVTTIIAAAALTYNVFRYWGFGG